MGFKKIKTLIELVSLGIGFKNLTKCAYGTLGEKELDSLFNKFSRSYQKSATAVLENTKNNTQDAFNNVLFHVSSLGSAIIFGYKGDYENAKKICQFALDNVPTKSARAGEEEPGIKKADLGMFEKLIKAYELRELAIEIEKETPGLTPERINKSNYSSDIVDKLEITKAQLHNIPNDKINKIGKPGEQALLYFMLGDKDTANQMLEVLFQNAKQTTKYLLPEVFENAGFAQVSPIIGASYVKFAQEFINLKEEQMINATQNKSTKNKNTL